MSDTSASKRLKPSSVQPDALGELVPGFAVEDGRRLRRHAVVLDERPRTEVAEPESGKRSRSHARRRVHRNSSRDHAVEGAWDERLVFRHVLEARVRERQIQVDRHPRVWVEVVRELEPIPAARRSRLGAAGIADVNQLRVEVEVPDRRGRLQLAHGHVADAELGALRARERRRGRCRIARHRIDRQHHAQTRVGMESPSPVGIELGAPPRTEHRRYLGAENSCGVLARS